MSDRAKRPSVADERAAAQARQREERAARRAARAEEGPDDAPIPGRGLIVASWVGTAVFTVSAVYSATIGYDAHSSPPGDPSGIIVSLLLFAIGCVLFGYAFLAGAQRSREAEMGVGGWFLLLGSAPGKVQAHLLGSLGVEIVVAFATAGARSYSTLAFGLLVPVYGLAICGIWGARYGSFPPRQVEVPTATRARSRRR